MSLDNYWVKDGEILYLDFCPELQLCGGLCSANGSGSFHGKRYAELIEEITGESLYQNIPNKTIKEMAEKLRNFINDDDFGFALDFHEISKQEYFDLVRMFKTYGEYGADLEALW